MNEDRELTPPDTEAIRWWWAQGVADGITKQSALRQFDLWLAGVRAAVLEDVSARMEAEVPVQARAGAWVSLNQIRDRLRAEAVSIRGNARPREET